MKLDEDHRQSINIVSVIEDNNIHNLSSTYISNPMINHTNHLSHQQIIP